LAIGSLLVGCALAASVARADAKAAAAPTTAPAVASAGSSRGASSSLARADRPVRVLFIGNSYTYYNGGLGSLVQALAAGAKDARRVEFVEVTKGGQSLEGHWKDGKALAAIRKGGWDFVVLQEQSQRPIVDRERMWTVARQFDAEIHKVGAKTVFYETWARKNKPEQTAGLHQAYAGIAAEVAGTLAPAGLAWQAAFKARPGLVLHIADLSHPTPAGSYLNACVMYDTLFGKSAAGLPRTLKNAAGKVLVNLTEADAKLLQGAADETCGEK
jgi:hypothetical protein